MSRIPRRLTVPSLVLATLATGGRLCAQQTVPAGAEPAASCASEALISHTVDISTGITVHYMEACQRRNNTIIFLHGFIDSWQSFELVLPELAKTHHVMAMDQRGHGDTSKPETSYTQADYAADVDAFMAALEIHKATIVGHSMGAFVAHKFAIEHPERVKRLVLMGNAPACQTERCYEINDFIQTLEDPIDPDLVASLQRSSFYNPPPEDFFSRFVSQSLKVPANVWRQAFAGIVAENHVEQLGQITAPTLIMWGDKDEFTLEEQLQLDSLIPDSILMIFPDTGHMVHVEQADAVIAAIRRFAK